MVHRILPVEPAFAIASTAFTSVANSHIATTVYPQQIELQNGTTELRHWMVISVESEKTWALEPPIKVLATAAQHTIQNKQSSIDWTVKRITAEGSMSTYANPDSYRLFCQQHPAASDDIAQHVPDTIVVEYYERHIGKALYSA